MSDSRRLNVAFFGSGEFGVPTLERLAQRHNLLAIFTQPDKPAGRKRRLTPTPVAQFAAERLPHVPLYKPANVNDHEHIAALRDLPLGEAEILDGPDVPAVRPRGAAVGAAVVIAFGQKLGRELMQDRLFVNLHASRLPRWRGAAPINHAILAGDTITGNSVITLADRMDAGLVLGASSRPIEPTVTAGALHDALAADGPALVEDVLAGYADDRLEPLVQDESAVTIAGKLDKAMGRADFAAGPAALVRQMHAFNPWPAVTAVFRREPVKLLRAEPIDGPPAVGEGAAKPAPPDAEQSQVATAVVIEPSEGLVRCGVGDNAGLVRLLELQPSGKRPMPWRDFANGLRVAAGETFKRPEDRTG